MVRYLMLGTDLAGGCESSDVRPPSLSMEESSAKVSLISRGDKPDLEKGEVTPTEEPEGGERLAGTNRVSSGQAHGAGQATGQPFYPVLHFPGH